MVADEIGPVEKSEDSFTKRWEALTGLAEHVFRKGFDDGEVLGMAAHEVRGLACHLLDEDRLLVMAGDKLGFWYAGTFDSKTGKPADLTWHELPSVYEGETHYVIDILRIVSWQGEPAVVVGTRGDGARIAPLSAVSRRDWKGAGLVALPGGEGRAVRRILFDPVAQTLWAVCGTDLLVWSLATETPRLVRAERLEFRVTALAIDRWEDDPALDQLYVATNLCGLHRFDRAPDGSFRVTADDLRPENSFWQGRASVLEWLEPISAICRLNQSTGRWVRRYKDRGVFGATLRHLVLISDDPMGSSTAFSQNRIVTLDSKILDFTSVCFPSWQCLAVATLEGKVRIFRPSGMRKPEREFAPYSENLPESSSPSALLSGFEDARFPERIYGFACPSPYSSTGGYRFPIVFGLGNHQVRLHQLTIRWDLQGQARRAAAELATCLPIDACLDQLERIALSPDQQRREKNGLIQIMPELGRLCVSQARWKRLRLLIWDVLANLEDRAIPVSMIQALRRLQASRSDRREEIEETITTIRKYVLDQSSFSEKETDFLKLVHSTDPSLADDRMIYQSILCSRRHDPVFHREFMPSEQFGEVQSFAAVPQPSPGGSLAPFDETEPERMRFLVGTYRRTIWLLDGTGRAQRLEGSEEEWGYIQAIHFRGREAVLSFSEEGFRRLRLDELTVSWEKLEKNPQVQFLSFPGRKRTESAQCFCSLPDAGPEDQRFLWGDASGKIWLTGDQGSQRLLSLGRIGGSTPPPAVQELRSFHLAFPDGSFLPLIAACTSVGSLHLLNWTPSPQPALQELEATRIGNTAATSLLVVGVSPPQIVVAGKDGLVVGYWVLPQMSPEGEKVAHLALYWAYRAEEAVRAVQPLDPASTATSQNSHEQLIVAGSYDEHLHVLDLLGRHLEIVYLPNIKVDRFITGKILRDESHLAEARVYACSFENQFRCLRIVSRRRLLGRIRASLLQLDEDEREESLSRWRAYSLREGHLRHRFARQSRRYPGPRALDVLEEIRRFLQIGDSSDRPTGITTALLRRLFQNRTPDRKQGEGETLTGLREILASPDLYLATIQVLHELEEQWNTPGSVENRRVQLFWIRSFLRNLETLEMLRQWITLGTELGSKEPLAAPDKLLYHFLDRAPELIQLKTLQYVERLLFGWQGIEQKGVFRQGQSICPADLEWLLVPLLLWLRAHGSMISRQRPHPVVLQIGRLFGLLLKSGDLDPLYLSHRLQDQQIPSELDKILIDQCSAMGFLPLGDEGSLNRDAAALLRQAAGVLAQERLLEELLDERRPIDEIVVTMEEILDHARSAQEGVSAAGFLSDVHRYFKSIIPLLNVKRLRDLYQLKGSWHPTIGEVPSFPSAGRLADLTLVLDEVAHYWGKKHEDLEIDPMRRLKYTHFHQLRMAWRMARSSIRENLEVFSRQEQRLLECLLEQWGQVLDDEQNKHLLQDLFQILDKRLREVPKTPMNAAEAMVSVAQEERLTFTAFSNLFTRLLLFSEPTRALFIYRGVETRSIGSRRFVQNEDPDSYELIDNELTQSESHWINPSWTSWSQFDQIDGDAILEWLKHGEPELEWRVVPIPSASESALFFGFYIFGWKPSAQSGIERFDLHQLTWVPLLQALAFRQASVGQDAMKGRIFSIVAHNLGAPVFKMRSDLGVLLQGFLEDQPVQREEKYFELLRQARHMTGIIDGILSLSAREPTVELSEISMANVVYEVVRTVRKDARGKKIEIQYPKPDWETQNATRFRTDEVKVYDILLNLLGNAIKYSPPGSSVEVALQMLRRGAEITVRDEGPGIPRSEINLIFDPFFRGSIPIDQGVQGLGLGLYVSRLYTMKLSGRINAINNSDGRGVTFRVYLPLQESSNTHVKEEN